MTQTVPCDRWEHAAGTVDQEILGPRLMSQTVADNADVRRMLFSNKWM